MAEKSLVSEIRDAREAVRKPARKAEDVIGSEVAIRKGEDSMSSRPFNLLRLLGANAKALDEDKAKVEFDICRRFNKALEESGNMISGRTVGSIMYPVSKGMLASNIADNPVTTELLSSAAASMSNVDLDEVSWIANKSRYYVEKGYSPRYVKTAMSYLTDTTGGALVAPPEMGELIPLMRNKSALDRAGARQVPLPAQGKWVAPRVTGPTTGYWIGENTAITESNPTTGQVEMMAKKLAATARVPNELFKYASAAADALLREDMTKTLALGIDYAGLYGAGGGGQPKGAIRYTGTNEVLFYADSTPTPGGVAANGNTINPQDGYAMAAAISDRNFDTDGNDFKWIMRPKMWGALGGRRADAVTAGDSAGGFVQAWMRGLGDGLGDKWCNHSVVQSSQVTNAGTKGGGTGLTDVWGGVWSKLLIGMYGAVEFVSNPWGESSFQADQTLVRAILHCDSVLIYPGAVSVYEDVIMA